MPDSLGPDELEALVARLPHQPPMRLIGKLLAVDPGRSATALRRTAASDWFFDGHFPGVPVVPAIVLNELIAQTAAVGWSSDIPIDITEYGMATDNGADLNNNYDWPTNQTYQQAGDAVTLTVAQMLAYAPLASRLRLFTYFQGHDRRASGTGERENYFGVVKNDGSAKGGLTAAVIAVADAHPAH